jgi:hypothetical protein
MVDYTVLMARIDVVGNTLVQEISYCTFRTRDSQPRGWRRQHCIWCSGKDTRGPDDNSPLVSGHKRR